MIGKTEYVCDPRYGWVSECEQRAGAVPVQVFHEGNTATHVCEHEGRAERRPLTRAELQAFFDVADAHVEKAAGSGRKGWLAGFRDATLFKVVYGWGLKGRRAMGRASGTKREATRQQKIAAQRAAARRAQVRNRVLLASGAVAAVIAIVVALVVVKTVTGSPAAAGPASRGGASNGPTGAALATVVSEVTHVPASMLNAVGAGSGVTGTPQPVKGPLLTNDGRPEVLYIGAEYCPFCAAERWAAIVALSRFGTFSGLRTVHSSSIDVDANTPTFTFYKSGYTSKYVTFTPVETYTSIPSGSFYTPLQKPTANQQALMNTYDAPPYVPAQDQGSIPFYDLGGKYVIIGASYSPQILDGKSWSQIAAALRDPSSPVAQAVDGTANYLTAAICTLTGNQPASACTPAVRALEAKL